MYWFIFQWHRQINTVRVDVSVHYSKEWYASRNSPEYFLLLWSTTSTFSKLVFIFPEFRGSKLESVGRASVSRDLVLLNPCRKLLRVLLVLWIVLNRFLSVICFWSSIESFLRFSSCGPLLSHETWVVLFREVFDEWQDDSFHDLPCIRPLMLLFIAAPFIVHLLLCNIWYMLSSLSPSVNRRPPMDYLKTRRSTEEVDWSIVISGEDYYGSTQMHLRRRKVNVGRW